MQPAAFFLKSDGRFDYLLKPDLERKKRAPEGPKIRCPKCAWQPRAGDLWACHCGHQWNTFDTRGKCPGCGFQWTQTACLRCTKWSEHVAWYVSGDGPPQ